MCHNKSFRHEEVKKWKVNAVLSDHDDVANALWRKLATSFNKSNIAITVSVSIQSTLVISKSMGPSETLRDIRTSTYQMYSIEENTNGTTDNIRQFCSDRISHHVIISLLSTQPAFCSRCLANYKNPFWPVEFSINSIWMSPFLVSGESFYFYCTLYVEINVNKQLTLRFALLAYVTQTGF